METFFVGKLFLDDYLVYFAAGLRLREHTMRRSRGSATPRQGVAEQCPQGNMSLVLGSSQLGLQIHESIGHPIELDRVLGMEANFAGTSFLTLEKLRSLRYGSDLVNVVADATDLTDPSVWRNGTTDSEIFRSIRDGAGASMPAFKSQIRQEEDLWHLVNYIHSLWPESKRPPLQEK